MTRFLAMDLGVSYEAFLAGSLPAWLVNRKPHSVEGELPEEEHHANVLVYARVSGAPGNVRAVYVGHLVKVTFDRAGKRVLFDYFNGLATVEAGAAGDDNPLTAERVSNRSPFSYLSEDAFDRVMREGLRRVLRLSPDLANALPGYAAESNMEEDAVIEQALREYFERNDWSVD